MKLYHVSFLDELEAGMKAKVFMPRIPNSCAPDEDQECPRICLTPSVEECVQAMASSSRNLKKGATVTVYSAEIAEDDDCLVWPDKVVESVPDALENREFWYLAPLKMMGETYRVCDFYAYSDHAWSVIKPQDVRRAIWLLNLDDKAKDEYLDAISGCSSALEAYQRVARKAQCRGEVGIEDFLDLAFEDIPWSRITRVERVQLTAMMEGEKS